jgi:cyclic pyranopterin phosphate synthase
MAYGGRDRRSPGAPGDGLAWPARRDGLVDGYISIVSGFTHLDGQGRARMVDVTGKPPTLRRATARCVIRTTADLGQLLADEEKVPLRAAEMAGLHAAKRTWDLIPLCHPIPLEGVTVRVEIEPGALVIEAVTQVVAQTGVEMEALMACAGAGLSLLGCVLRDDPLAELDDLAVWRKSGGRSGDWGRGASGPSRAGARR